MAGGFSGAAMAYIYNDEDRSITRLIHTLHRAARRGSINNGPNVDNRVLKERPCFSFLT